MNDIQIEDYLGKAQDKIDHALQEMIEVKIIRENDPTEFAYAQKRLEDMKEEIASIIDQVSTEEKVKLTEALNRLRDAQETMIRGI